MLRRMGKKSQRYRQNHAEENGTRSHKDTDKTMRRRMGLELRSHYHMGSRKPWGGGGGGMELEVTKILANLVKENEARSHNKINKIL